MFIILFRWYIFICSVSYGLLLFCSSLWLDMYSH